MVEAFAVEATIARSVKDVWAALTAWCTAHRWMAGIEHVRAGGPTAPGTTLTFRARGKDRVAEITAAEDERAVVIRSVQGGVTADYRYGVEPLGAKRPK